MQDILRNLAALDLLEFCKAQNIPANGYNGEGTTTVKNGRGFKYSLVTVTTGRAIVTVTFHKSSVPTHTIHER